MAGMLVQGALGIDSIWGNIVIYVTSKLRAEDPNLSTQFALIIFPMTFIVGSVGMQMGSWLMDRIHPRLQIALGGIIYVIAIYCSQYANKFSVFILLYGVLAGIGFGIIYYLPLKCAWTYFPKKRNLVTGIILCCYSLNAMILSNVTTNIVNPYN